MVREHLFKTPVVNCPCRSLCFRRLPLPFLAFGAFAFARLFAATPAPAPVQTHSRVHRPDVRLDDLQDANELSDHVRAALLKTSGSLKFAPVDPPFRP